MLILKILHVIGMVFGFGGALVSCAIMLHIRTDKERFHRGRIARRISIVTWTGLAILLISGISLTVSYNTGYNIFLAVKHLFVTIIVIDAFIIHFRLFRRYFHQIGTPNFDVTYTTMRRIAIHSMACWISTFVISAFI